MQGASNMYKRKHPQDGGDRDVADVKHQKHSVKRGHPPYHSISDTASKIDGNGSERGPHASQSEKLANLISALDEALEEDSLNEILVLVGEESLNRCVDLRTCLLKNKSRIDAAAIKTPPTSQLPSHDTLNLPSSISAFSLTPWKSSEIPSDLPSLPKVLDRTLEEAAFTHLGMGSGRVTDLNYERLEWVGDAYLYLTSTLLISQTFPSLLPGKCSHIRERLVKNMTLADYARQYSFEPRAKLPDQLLGASKYPLKDQDKTKIMGDIFEAYVAAVVLSDPLNGVVRVTDWLKKLWSMTIKKEIIYEEKNGMKIDSPLWRLRGSLETLELVPSAPPPLGPKEQLQKLLGSKNVKLTYKDAAPEKKDRNNKLPLFTVGVYLDGWGEKGKQLGFGTGNGKKDAGKKAAEMALANKSLMKVYTERKRIFDAQMELERQALEQLEARENA